MEQADWAAVALQSTLWRLCQGLIVHAQVANALTARAAGHEQHRISSTSHLTIIIIKNNLSLDVLDGPAPRLPSANLLQQGDFQ
jgi:hypothetical protein